jgi:hypothetical protein
MVRLAGFPHLLIKLSPINNSFIYKNKTPLIIIPKYERVKINFTAPGTGIFIIAFLRAFV